jgi:hypothetical protein
MIEAIVASALLVVVALGVLKGLDTANRSSGREKARSSAAALTEQDQERLRSFRAVDLANYDETRTVTVNKVQYKIVSQSDWVRDSTGGTESCNSNTVQADYMRITSTTTSGLINTPIPPIKMSSLVAPPVGAFGANQGTLGVQVNDRNGIGVPGVNVTITGPATVSNPTNSAGCAIFAFVPTGSYVAGVNIAGYVDRGGNQNATVGATVSQGTVKVAAIDYDIAASVAVTFDTEARDGTIPLIQPAASRMLAAANSGVPAGPFSLAGLRKYDPTGSPVLGIAATGLFPFTDGYGLYGGGCPGADPTDIPGLDNYYDLYPDEHITTDPGQVVAPVVVRLPSINLRVLYNGSASPPATKPVKLVITPMSTGCSADKLVINDATELAGWMKNPALPFGDYKVCASMAMTSSSTIRQRTTSTNIPNRYPQGIKPPSAASPVINVLPTDTTGACT